MAAVETRPITDHYRAAFKRTLAVEQHAWLTPLLFETSRQALCLKPTVITLAYGL